MTFNEVLKNFQVKSRYQNRAQCVCPSHDDKQASLTITAGQKGILLHCHAGCTLESVLEAAHLKKSDLFYDEQKPRSSWRSYIEQREGRAIEAVYQYSYCSGDSAFCKVRLAGKKFVYGALQDSRFRYGLPKPRRELPAAVYGDLKALKQAISEDRPVFYVEGERDVQTMTKQGYAAITAGSVNDWRSDVAQLFKGANVVVLADNDAPGQNLARRVQADLQGIAKSVGIITPMPDTPHADVSDYFAAGHSREDFEGLIAGTAITKKPCTGLPIESVRQMLAYKIEHDRDGNEKSRKIMQTIRNHEIALKNDARFAGRICFNEFSQQAFLMGDMPWETGSNYRAWTSYDDSALFSILQSDYGLTNRNDYFDAIKNVAMQNKFHPVRDLLGSLKWDNAEHIRNLLPEYLGATDSEYNYQVMRLWMVGAVARICQPGCKFDYTIILQGRQGIGKSTFLQLLALNDQWFSDSLDSLDGDKAAQSLIGTWIVELAELKSLARTAGGVESVKRFLSATQDKYRVPYERRADVFLRQCVFAGTTNRSDFLQDETGNRRFLIVQTGATEPSKSLFEPSAMDDIQQAWAQAFHIWKAEHPKLVLSESCSEEAQQLQQEYLADDGKAGLIAEYLADKQRVCVLEIWQKALQENGRPQKWQSAEISGIVLGMAGWGKMKSPARFGEYGMQRGFQKKCQQTGACRQDFLQVSDEELSELPFE